MSENLMTDKNQPEPEPGTATNIMTRRDMRKTIVKVTFVKRSQRLPDVRPRRWEFATVVMANEFIQTIKPPPGAQLGSPKQWKAKIARLLRLTDISMVNNYELHCELEVSADVPAGEDFGGIELDEPIDTFVEGTTEPDALDESILDAIQPLQINPEDFGAPE